MACVGERFYHCKATGMQNKINTVLYVLTFHAMETKSNLYFWEEYENVPLCSVFYVFLELNSIYENCKDVNKIVINPKYSYKLGHIICLYII